MRVVANEAKLAARVMDKQGVWLTYKHNDRTPLQFYFQVGSLMRTGDTFEQAFQTCGGAILWPEADATPGTVLGGEQSRDA